MYTSNLIPSVSSAGSGLVTVQGNGAMKASIILFDTTPGTRNFTVPAGVSKIRAFVVGSGSGNLAGGNTGGGYSEKVISVTPGAVYSYTVGTGGSAGGNGNTSSFGGIISATGGTSVPGVGSGGDINTSGGQSYPSATASGSASGHRFGNGYGGVIATSTVGGGSGWSGSGSQSNGGPGGVDGFGLGLIPGQGGYVPSTASNSATGGGYGAGGGPGSVSGSGGLGGGGSSGCGAAGAIGSSAAQGGNGGVGVEVIG